jgi:hypothetical protein
MSLNYEDYEPRLNTKDKLERKRKKNPPRIKEEKKPKGFFKQTLN